MKSASLTVLFCNFCLFLSLAKKMVNKPATAKLDLNSEVIVFKISYPVTVHSL